MLIEWPYCALTPQDGFSPSKKPATVKGNPSGSGFTQVSASTAGRWFVKAKGISLTTPEKIRMWRAIEGIATGQLGQFVLPVIENGRAPLDPNIVSIPHSDDTFFSDGAGYSSDSYVAKAAFRVGPGAAEIAIDHTGFAAPVPGQLFSAGVRLYSINKIVATTSTTVTVSIWPTARVEIYANQPLRFDRPKILCRLASDDEMEIDALMRNKAQSADLNFIEDTGPVLP